ncbi:synergin gamma isoform X3 [Ornithorhynchus anatinus]|uniref:synergin gamma isoform X3 n=1 Tax=Ornithorhynchus anatinus TaxID=9258 RepID=UPI0010A90ADB|nr:synergin gamma isoform X3 [Ornithorhynchus anatinus]
MALRPGAPQPAAAATAPPPPPGPTAAAAAAGGAGGGGSFMFPVAGGLGPPQGMMPLQQQGFPMVSVMQPNMQGIMGMNYSSQMSTGPLSMQGGIPLGPMPAGGLSYMGQAPFLGMRPPGPQYTPDMQKQFAEEQQKRFEHQQKLLEEERKRRQFEEQKQKLRLLSSVKPKTGEKSRDDALEAIKGNLDGFSRDAKMHPTPSSHPKKTDCLTPSHSTITVSQTSAFIDEDGFSDFVHGPLEIPTFGTPPSSRPFQSFHPTTLTGRLLSEKAVSQPPPPVQMPMSAAQPGASGPLPFFSTASTSLSPQKTGLSLEEKLLTSCDLSTPGQGQIKFNASAPGPQASTSAASKSHPGFPASSRGVVGGPVSGPAPAEAEKATDPNLVAVEESGVGVYPSQDPIQPMMPSWIYNENLVPDLYKKILETTMTPTGIDTAKLYPILMSSGLPRETLGQIWALANRTTPGKLTKEELYTVLALIAVTQRGMPPMSPDALSQFPTAPVPTLSGFPLALPGSVNQQGMMPSGSAASRPLGIPQPGLGIPVSAPAGAASGQVSSAFISPYPAHQGAKQEEDDFQEFQDASKSGSLDDPFTDFHAEMSAPSKMAGSQPLSSAPSLLVPFPGTKSLSTTDKYAAFKGIATNKPSESGAPFGECEDRYSAFRELEQPAENKSLGDSFAEFRSAGTDDGFTDFKTADSVSPLEPPAKDRTFPAPFPSFPLQQKQPLNLAELDMFSSVGPPGEKSLPFPAPLPSSSKPVSVGSLPPAVTAAAPTAPSGATKNSSLADDFGEFNLFGAYSNCASVGGQDDFADFMAFNNGRGSSEPKADDRGHALREEARPLPPTDGSSDAAGDAGENPPAPSTKYDVFRQLSLEGSGLGFEEPKEGSPSVKSDDDFADFHASRGSSAGGGSEKAVAFRHAKEDSASVKSLDLPSIGGSSVGKEDSEDALSVQFDMKLADVGGDLKHVTSDSSLDLPMVSGQNLPAAAGGEASLATSALQKEEISFGRSENVTRTTASKGATFLSDDHRPEATSFKDGGELLDFAMPPSEGPRDGPPADPNREAAAGLQSAPRDRSQESLTECPDDFGEFQSEKPKISKFDFLLAHSQNKMKSSEEMIKSELATFDLSVQGSHKRSLSLGDKEISHSSPSPALEQPFRDRSNTVSEKPAALPVIRDKYKDLTGEVEESERYAYEWKRCLGSALQVIKKANDTLNGISSSSVCTEVIQSAQGMEYLLGVVEVYRVTKRVELGIKATAVCSESLQQLLKDIDKIWNNLIGFMSLATLTPDENSLDFSSCMLRPGIKNAQELACGVCLLNVDSRSRKEEKPAEEHLNKAFNSETDNFKLAYGGHQYHASCANFWINCVEPKPPGLILPDLL